MRLRNKVKKWLYGSCYGFAGAMPYFGTKVYFPKNSHIFQLACEQGVFENDNILLVHALLREGGWYFDVGANIGLMSIPLLHANPGLNVVSFEPSSNVLPFLRRTIEGSNFGNRWMLVHQAVGATIGKVEFFLSSEEKSVYDGLKPTNRAPLARTEEVALTTLDAEWSRLGRPKVSVIKCDVEGAEHEVLLGARRCIKETQPHILIEWNDANLAAFRLEPEAILEFARGEHYECFAAPHLIPIRTARELRAQMLRTESFLLSPSVPVR